MITKRRIIDTTDGQHYELSGLTSDPLTDQSLVLVNPQDAATYHAGTPLGSLPGVPLVGVPRTSWFELKIVGYMMTDEGCKPIYRSNDETTRARTPDVDAPATPRPRGRRSRRVPDSKPGSGDNTQ